MIIYTVLHFSASYYSITFACFFKFKCQFSKKLFSVSKPVKINILNNTHILEPPVNEYTDPAFRRARDYQPELQLEWIYGYNGTKCRNNIYVLPSNEILYFVSKVVVIYNEQTQQQRFYIEHTDEICSIAQHPNTWVFATGQVSGGLDQEELAHVRIWDSKILVTLNTLDLTEVNLRVEHLDFSEVRIIDSCVFFRYSNCSIIS